MCNMLSCWNMLGVLFGSFPLASLRLWSCAGAVTTNLRCSHDGNEEQASDTTHFHRYIATEVLSRILNLRSVVSAAKSEHADSPTMGGAEKLLQSLCSPDKDILYRSLPIPSLDCWNQQISCHGSPHPTIVLDLLCRANLTLCPAICLSFIQGIEIRKKLVAWDANESGCTYTWEELDKPKEFAAQGQVIYFTLLPILPCCLHIENMYGIEAGAK